jgi:hypothetical protein
MLNVKTRFVGSADTLRQMSYMDAPLMERLEVTLSAPTVVVPMYRPGELDRMLTPPWDRKPADPGSETRAEFGERLRRAAREATRGIENAILKSLREQGHLV